MQELNQYAYAVAAQSGRGTVNATPQKRPVHVAGDVKPTRDVGSEPFSDLTKFGDATDWLNSISGAGSPSAEMTANELAYYLWLYHGAETNAAAVNEVQSWSLSGAPTGGAITLLWAGVSLGSLAWNTTAAQLQTALEATGKFTAGHVVAAGGPWPAAITLTYSGATVSGRPWPVATVSANALTGGAAPTYAGARTTQGTKKRKRFVGSALTFFYFTMWKRLGLTEIDRHVFADCRIGQMVLEASTGNKAGRMTPTIFSLDPAINKTADPAWPTIPSRAPLLHTEGRGAYTVDGIVHTGLSQWAVTLNEDLQPVFGDDTYVADLVRGQPAATIGATLLLDAQAHALWNRQMYGTATPANDQKPTRDVSALGSYTSSVRQRDASGVETGDRLDVTFPGVMWTPPEKPDPNPAGGSAEISLAGAMRPLSGQEPYTIDVYMDDAAYAVI